MQDKVILKELENVMANFYWKKIGQSPANNLVNTKRGEYKQDHI